MNIGQRLKKARRDKGLSQKELADLAGVTQQTIDAIEHGRSNFPRNIEKLAKILDKTVEWLLFGLVSEESEIQVFSLPLKRFRVPLIEWDSIDHYIKLCLNKQPIQILEEKKLIPYMSLENEFLPPYLIGLRVQGDAMTSPQPNSDSLIDGDIVYVDLEKRPSKTTTVLAIINNHYQLRQFVIDGTQKKLKPLNPVYETVEINEKNIIVGQVTDVWRKKSEN